MKRKKILSVIAAVVVVASLAMGSLAYFTSKESVTNSFSTLSQGDEKSGGDSGIDIHENFDKDSASKMLPGDQVNKDVWVQSTANYDQILRVKVTPEWKDQSLNNPENNKLIELNFTKSGDWVKGKDGYYYYTKILEAGKRTDSNLLDAVTLNAKMNKKFAGKGFDVVVQAESLQATSNAFNETWKTSAGDGVVIGGLNAAKVQSDKGVDKTADERTKVVDTNITK